MTTETTGTSFTETVEFRRFFHPEDGIIGQAFLAKAGMEGNTTALQAIVCEEKRGIGALEVKALYGQHVTRTTANKYTREGVVSPFFLDPSLMAATYGGLFATLNPPISVAGADDDCASARHLRFRSFYEQPVGAMLMVVKLWDVASQTFSNPVIRLLGAPSPATLTSLATQTPRGVLLPDLWDPTVLLPLLGQFPSAEVCPILFITEGNTRTPLLRSSLTTLLKSGAPVIVVDGLPLADIVVSPDHSPSYRALFLPVASGAPIGMTWPIGISFPDLVASILRLGRTKKLFAPFVALLQDQQEAISAWLACVEAGTDRFVVDVVNFSDVEGQFPSLESGSYPDAITDGAAFSPLANMRELLCWRLLQDSALSVGSPTQAKYILRLQDRAVPILNASTAYHGGSVSPSMCANFLYHFRPHGGWPTGDDMLQFATRVEYVSRDAGQYEPLILEIREGFDPDPADPLDILLTREQANAVRHRSSTPRYTLAPAHNHPPLARTTTAPPLQFPSTTTDDSNMHVLADESHDASRPPGLAIGLRGEPQEAEVDFPSVGRATEWEAPWKENVSNDDSRRREHATAFGGIPEVYSPPGKKRGDQPWPTAPFVSQPDAFRHPQSLFGHPASIPTQLGGGALDAAYQQGLQFASKKYISASPNDWTVTTPEGAGCCEPFYFGLCYLLAHKFYPPSPLYRSGDLQSTGLDPNLVLALREPTPYFREYILSDVVKGEKSSLQATGYMFDLLGRHGSSNARDVYNPEFFSSVSLRSFYSPHSWILSPNAVLGQVTAGFMPYHFLAALQVYRAQPAVLPSLGVPLQRMKQLGRLILAMFSAMDCQPHERAAEAKFATSLLGSPLFGLVLLFDVPEVESIWADHPRVMTFYWFDCLRRLLSIFYSWAVDWKYAPNHGIFVATTVGIISVPRSFWLLPPEVRRSTGSTDILSMLSTFRMEMSQVWDPQFLSPDRHSFFLRPPPAAHFQQDNPFRTIPIPSPRHPPAVQPGGGRGIGRGAPDRAREQRAPARPLIVQPQNPAFVNTTPLFAPKNPMAYGMVRSAIVTKSLSREFPKFREENGDPVMFCFLSASVAPNNCCDRISCGKEGAAPPKHVDVNVAPFSGRSESFFAPLVVWLKKPPVRLLFSPTPALISLTPGTTW